MKTAGIVGGIGPESTIDYYRSIVAAYRAKRPDAYPALIINSIDAGRLLGLMGRGRFDDVAGYLSTAIEQLARGGADFAVLAANTPHLVFETLADRSPIPLISIVEVTCEAARAQGLRRVGLFGTKFTMQGRFYPDVFAKADIAVMVPSPGEQALIHQKYMTELLNNVFLPETRDELVAIMNRMRRDDHIEAVILGGTELPLLLRDAVEKPVPFLDTTQLHVESIVAELTRDTMT